MANQYSTRKPFQLPLPIEGSVVAIPLSGDVKTFIDAADGDLAQYKWSIRNRRYPYATRIVQQDHKRQIFHLHRIIIERVLGRALSKADIVDHIDGNPLNNRRNNLRIATRQTNMANSKRSTSNTSGYKGVTFVRGRWRATIVVNGKRKWLGAYRNIEDAIEAYRQGAIKYFGEFARLD